MKKTSTNIYCSFCGKRIEECTCRKSNPIETKVIKPEETKEAKKTTKEVK